MFLGNNRTASCLVGALSLVAWLGLATAAVAQQVDYNRADRFLTWNTSLLVSGDQVRPNWMADKNRFWYRNKTSTGHEFVLVDPIRNSQGPLFDHYRMAAAMSLTNDTSYVPQKLPFNTVKFIRSETAIEFTAGKKKFECHIRSYACTVEEADEDEAEPTQGFRRGRFGAGGGGRFVVSPDSVWEAFAKDYNLYMRPRGGGDTTQLTTDGEKYWAYGFNEPRPNQQRHGGRAIPNRLPYPGFHIITLEPDIAADEQGEQGGPRDANGSAPSVRVVGNVAPRVEPIPHQLSFGSSAVDSTWAATSDKLYVTYFTRGSKKVFLAEIDANTGDHRVIVGDSAKTFVETSQRNPSSWWVSDNTDDVLWWSERDGWAHIYRFDKQGNLKNQVTSGPWTVGYIARVDEDNQQIFFTGQGREEGSNIYYAHLYRVNFDGSGLALITPEDGNHQISWSPSGRFFVDTYSKIESPPVTVLRDATGRIIRTLEEADVSRLIESGWTPADVFSVKARDGVTDIYGVIYFPPDIDETKKYPIISHIYPGPQVGSVGSWTFKGGGEDFSLAQLGFVVIQLDHLGTPLRSKAFHDNYFGNFTDNGLLDHVTAIKQLAARYPFIDVDRVGIYGHSGGGFASTDAILRFPDFFKVAVSGAGNHNNASYNIYWAEKYQGLMERDTLKSTDNFGASANKTYVKNLKGKLLLMHGDMDDNVHPANTIQLINELIKANKDFDFIIAPDRAHGLNEPYFIRRRWDYFVRHLLGAEPPKEYAIKRPEGGGTGR